MTVCMTLPEEFESEMKGQKSMAVDVLVTKAIAGIESGETEIRPGSTSALSDEPFCSVASVRANGKDAP
jgi:hypothetical protein